MSRLDKVTVYALLVLTGLVLGFTLGFAIGMLTAP